MSNVSRADALVIGGGIAGAALAWTLAGQLDVALVEREATPGFHATGRSASVLSETSGHPVVCALARASRPFFEHPPDGFCESPLLAELPGPGLMWIGRREDSAALDQLYETARAISPGIARLAADELTAVLHGFRPEAYAAGAVHEPAARSIDTAAALQSYIAGIRRRGGRVLTTTEAISATRSAEGWLVTAGTDRIVTPRVVDAAGAWGDIVAARCGVAPLGLRALRRTAAIVPAPAIVDSWPMVMDIAGRYYLKPEAGGLLVSAADETESDPTDARAEELDVAIALDRVTAATFVPVRSVRSAWAGLRTFAPDRVPVAGEDPGAPGFWWLVGQGGAGIKTAPALAAVLAAQITGAAQPVAGVDEAMLSPRRFR